MRFLLLLVVLGTASALAPLLKTTDAVPNRYIVKLKDDADLETVLRKVEFAAALDRNIKVTQTFTKVFNGFSARLTNDLLETIRNLGIVEYVEEDSIVKIAEVASWGLDRVDQLVLPLDDSYHPIGDGDGVHVYVLDTGVTEYNEDFGERAVNAYDAMGEDGVDCHGHGSYSCGIVGGKTFGVAKSAHIIGIRVLGCNGYGFTSDVIKGCDWVIENGVKPAVASMSVETSASPAMDEGVQALINNLMQVVVAAGNEGTNACKKSPARVLEAITVGATDVEDVRAHFSNYGTCVDIFAPGVDIASVWISGNDATNIISGTSVATSHVAGAAAILLGLNNQLSPKELKKMLQEKAIVNAVKDAQPGSPNLLLYIGEGSGGGADPRATSTRLSNTLSVESASAACYSSGLITISGTDVCSPGYPSYYDNNQYYRTEIQASYGQTIKLSFSVFSSEHCCDMLFVYDGDNTECPLVTLKGDDIPPPIYSTKHSMVLVFSTDYSVTYRGYLGTVTFIGDPQPNPTATLPPTPAPCNISEPITTSGTDVTSPGWPNDYDNNLNCLTKIQASFGQTIKLSFSDLDLDCGDVLEVYDGDTTGYPIEILCGSLIPYPIYSFGPSMTLVFYSDDFANGGVYLGTVSFIGDRLPTVVLPPVNCNTSEPITISGTDVTSPGYPDYYMDNMYCRTEIQASYGQTIKLTFSNFDLECPDRLKVYEVDGYGFSYELADLCGYGPPEPIYSSGPSMVLEFSSDDFWSSIGYLGTVTFIGDPKPTPPPVLSPVICNTSEPITISGTDVASPGYPLYYSHNLYCRTEIQASYGQTIKLTFSDFDLDCTDSLKVYEVDVYGFSYELTDLCGYGPSEPIYSSGPSMVLEFSSNDFYISKGYLGTVTFIGDPKPTPPPVPPPPYCNTSEPITISGSDVASPGYPNICIDNMFCRTEIQASYGQTIRLSFSEFDLDCYDRLEVYDGIVEMYHLETLSCGSPFETPIYSTTSSMVLEFFNDDFYVSDGYLGTVTFIGDPKPTTPPVPPPAYCNTSEPITISGSDVASPGYPDYVENMFCRTEIQASYGQTIKLSFFDFNLDCSDRLEVYDGIVEMHHLATLSCSYYGTIIYSTTPSMVLEFSSHYSPISAGYLGTVTFIGDPKPTPPPVLSPVTCNNSEPITISGTNVASPGYPDYYMDNLYCRTEIQASQGQTIKLSFSEFSLEYSSSCFSDKLEVFDGESSMEVHCGSGIPSPIYSTGPSMLLEFWTDSSVTESGYFGTVTFIGSLAARDPTPCSIDNLITTSGANVTSPGWPNEYGNDLDCPTNIHADPDQIIMLTFSHFSLEYSSGCSQDKLVVYDGYYSSVLETLCDSYIPGPIYSTSPSMLLDFKTDSTISGSGYFATVTFIPKPPEPAPCSMDYYITTSGTNVTSPGWPNEYDNDLFCTTEIHAGPDEMIMLTFSDFSLEYSSGCSQDALVVVDDYSSSVLETLCDSYIPGPIYSTGPSMLLEFFTDSTVTGRGYFGTVTFIPRPAPCSNPYITTSGTNVTSPGWPNEYGNDLRCTIDISADYDQRIMLTFSDFSLEYSSGCTQDKLVVYDGYSYELETLCDTYIPGPIYSTSSSMRLEFITDSAVTGRGYFATVTFIPQPAPCSNPYIITSGTNVTSPGWPNEYGNDLECTIDISADYDQRIMLTFSNFSLEYSSGCSQDRLVVYDDSYSNELETLCDTYIPGPIYSTGPYMILEFITDSAGTGIGFFGTVTFIPKLPDPAPCSNPYITTSGTNVTSPGWPNEYGNDLSCWTSIRADPDQIIVLTFSNFSLEYSSGCSQDKLMVLDGYNIYDLCGSNTPAPIYSTSSYMDLDFFTDSTGTGRGYFGTVEFISLSASCNYEYITTNGTYVASPEWPNEYDNGLSCITEIQADIGQTIMLTFSNFNLEHSSDCSLDKLVVYNDHSECFELATLCGSDIPAPIYSTSSYMALKLVTDSTVRGAGYLATVTFIPAPPPTPTPAPCGNSGPITTNGTIVTSPGWPNDYGNNRDCFTDILSHDPDQTIMLTFSNFDVEYSSSCSQDYLNVYYDYDGFNFVTLCGSDIPEPFYSKGPQMSLQFLTDSTVSGTGYFATVTFIPKVQCNEQIKTSGTDVTSPGWPNTYRASLRCFTEIHASYGEIISLSFSDFNLEYSTSCTYDSLKVYDHDDALLEDLCGSGIPSTIYSTGPRMRLEFNTDYAVSGTGYFGTVTFITQSLTDIVSSPGWPNNYDDNLACSTHIQANDGQTIMLTFSDFDVEPSLTCSYDKLTIYDGDSVNGNKLTTLCGSDVPATVYSTGPSMLLVFSTDDSVTNSGYRGIVTYIGGSDPSALRAHPTTACESKKTDPNGNLTTPGYPSSYDLSMDCWTHIHSKDATKTVTLTFNAFEVEEQSDCNFDSVSVYDGVDENAAILGKFCGSTLPAPVSSSGPDMFVKFHSDTSVTANGVHATYAIS